MEKDALTITDNDAVIRPEGSACSAFKRLNGADRDSQSESYRTIHDVLGGRLGAPMKMLSFN